MPNNTPPLIGAFTSTWPLCRNWGPLRRGRDVNSLQGEQNTSVSESETPHRSYRIYDSPGNICFFSHPTRSLEAVSTRDRACSAGSPPRTAASTPCERIPRAPTLFSSPLGVGVYGTVRARPGRDGCGVCVFHGHDMGGFTNVQLGVVVGGETADGSVSGDGSGRFAVRACQRLYDDDAK